MELVQLILQKKWNGRKRSETWSGQNLFNPHILKNKHFPQRRFFLEGPKVSKGKRLETVGDRTFARQKRQVFTQFSNIFHEHMLQNNYFFAERRCDLRLFPTVSPWTPLDLQKKNGVARKCLFLKICGLNKFWPDHVSDRFRPFPTVSDRFRPFHFFWRINWTNSIYGRLIQCKTRANHDA